MRRYKTRTVAKSLPSVACDGSTVATVTIVPNHRTVARVDLRTVADTTHAPDQGSVVMVGTEGAVSEMERITRAEQWRQDQAERAAICAGLTWQDCVRALVAAKRMTPDLAGHMGVTL